MVFVPTIPAARYGWLGYEKLANPVRSRRFHGLLMYVFLCVIGNEDTSRLLTRQGQSLHLEVYD